MAAGRGRSATGGTGSTERPGGEAAGFRGLALLRARNLRSQIRACAQPRGLPRPGTPPGVAGLRTRRGRAVGVTRRRAAGSGSCSLRARNLRSQIRACAQPRVFRDRELRQGCRSATRRGERSERPGGEPPASGSCSSARPESALADPGLPPRGSSATGNSARRPVCEHAAGERSGARGEAAGLQGSCLLRARNLRSQIRLRTAEGLPRPGTPRCRSATAPRASGRSDPAAKPPASGVLLFCAPGICARRSGLAPSRGSSATRNSARRPGQTRGPGGRALARFGATSGQAESPAGRGVAPVSGYLFHTPASSCAFPADFHRWKPANSANSVRTFHRSSSA